MIIDSHVYCFTPVDTPGGHASGAERIKWVQAAHASHHQPAYRIKDRKPGASEVLNPGGQSDLSKLPDVSFRIDHAHGRVAWNWNGDEYTKQLFPPNLRNCEYTPHSLIGEMDYADVDVALMHTDPTIARGFEFLAKCVDLFPTRLRSMIPVDEWRIKDETDMVIEETTNAVKVHGLHALKFNPLSYMSGPEPWDGGVYLPFWDAVTRLDVPIFFTLGTGPNFRNKKRTIADQRQGYLNEQRILIRWMERYPHCVCSLTHGFPYRIFLEDGKLALPDEIWEPFKGKNCNIEACFPIRLGDIYDYPYREVWPAFEAMVMNIGADHLLWGTDMPFQNRFCTYRQSRRWIEKYCTDFIGQNEMKMILGGTAARILGIPTE